MKKIIFTLFTILILSSCGSKNYDKSAFIGSWNIIIDNEINDVSIKINSIKNYYKDGTYSTTGSLSFFDEQKELISKYHLIGLGKWIVSGDEIIEYSKSTNFKKIKGSNNRIVGLLVSSLKEMLNSSIKSVSTIKSITKNKIVTVMDSDESIMTR